MKACADEVLRTHEKASGVTQSRVWREFDAFVEGRTPQWARRAEAVLNDEGNRAAMAFETSGEGASVAAVDDAEWLSYLNRLWLTTVPDAGALILPFLTIGDDMKQWSKHVAKAVDPLTQAAINWIKANGAREASLISNASRKGIQEQIRIGYSKNETTDQITARIRKHYRSIRQSRAETIARTEVHAASNYGSLTAAAETNIPMHKIWVDTPDGRTRDHHVAAGGQKKPLGSPFVVDGERLMHPGDGSLGASAENLVNCRCTLFYVPARRVAPKPRRAA